MAIVGHPTPRNAVVFYLILRTAQLDTNTMCGAWVTGPEFQRQKDEVKRAPNFYLAY